LLHFYVQGSKVFLVLGIKQRVITEYTRIITSESNILNLADFERHWASESFISWKIALCTKRCNQSRAKDFYTSNGNQSFNFCKIIDRMGPFDDAVLKETAKKCTRKYNTRARRTVALSIESSQLCYFVVHKTVESNRSNRVFSSPVAVLFSLFGRKLKIKNLKNLQQFVIPTSKHVRFLWARTAETRSL